MSESKPQVGSVVWRDLTVKDADAVQNFYSEVVGWKGRAEADCDGDFNMLTPNGDVAAGICYARGVNANLPPQWLIYISVEDVKKSAGRCVELGGKIIHGPRKLGKKDFCVIQDPAGAVAGLITA
jgi:predicted enzyme related to lactoylglutathione lyase